MTTEFRMFQAQYLSVYLTIMLADWLQGTNMYTLYSSYGVNVGTLFLTGFLSSAVFGTFLGVYVDSYGRKLGCLIFCVLEIVINLLEHVPSMPALMVGRVLGGMSTSLLFTAFESWMVSEHKKRGFPQAWLASTFSIASWGNGFIAIAAGFLAQVASDWGGDIGPFQLAIALTVVVLVPICFWRENYGHSDSETIAKDTTVAGTGSKAGSKKGSKNGSKNGTSGTEIDTTTTGTDDAPRASISMLGSLRASCDIILQQPAVLCLGLSQAFFEGAVYTFVFMWVPSMLAVTKGALPTGLVFSAFMLSMTLGGMLFALLLPIFPSAEVLCVLIYAVAALAMLVPVFKFEFMYVLCACLVLEGMVGMFNSCGATLRSRYYPEGLHSSIMSVFRLPLNLLVVAGTRMTASANEVPQLQYVFGAVAGMHCVAMLLQLGLTRIGAKKKTA
ncbi:hypothetical protein B484DRAFT_333619 [Ochromonadaceae sp. CCMP2298]|nr:hypothetical protein B484DRAFT_333619 [Ochromonadaceae sp. CCMP2298]